MDSFQKLLKACGVQPAQAGQEAAQWTGGPIPIGTKLRWLRKYKSLRRWTARSMVRRAR